VTADAEQRQLVTLVADAVPFADRAELRSWLRRLLDIRSSELPIMGKAREALKVTMRVEVIWPAIKIISKALKRHGWDQRNKSSRFGIAGAAIGLAAFGGQSAGIAALGTAIGLPLWVVLGAGSLFASTLYDELVRRDAPAGQAAAEAAVNATRGEDGVHRF